MTGQSAQSNMQSAGESDLPEYPLLKKKKILEVC